MHLYSWKLVLNFLLLVLVLATQSCLTLWPHGLHPTRLLCPWDFSGKDTRVDCHFLLQGIFPPQRSNLCLLHCRQILYRLSYKVLVLGRQLFSLVYVSVAQSCPTLCNPMACSPPGSSVHRILQARILEWVVTPFSIFFFFSLSTLKIIILCSWLSLLLMWNQLLIYLLLINILVFLSGCFGNNCVFVFWSFTTMCSGMHFFSIILLEASSI